jgi:hypothetical protein
VEQTRNHCLNTVNETSILATVYPLTLKLQESEMISATSKKPGQRGHSCSPRIKGQCFTISLLMQFTTHIRFIFFFKSNESFFVLLGFKSDWQFKGHMVSFKLYKWRKTSGQVPLQALFLAQASTWVETPTYPKLDG